MEVRKNFTLVELLVVIGIIGILVTLVVANVSGGMSKADKLTCSNELKAVADAFKAYEMSYGVPPAGNDTDAMVKVLQAYNGSCGNDIRKNKKRIKFLDTKILTKEKTDGTLESEHHYDIWGGKVVFSGAGTDENPYKLTSPGEDNDPNTIGDNVVYEWK